MLVYSWFIRVDTEIIVASQSLANIFSLETNSYAGLLVLLNIQMVELLLTTSSMHYQAPRMARTYTCKSMTRKWPTALFYKIISVSAVNIFGAWLGLNALV